MFYEGQQLGEYTLIEKLGKGGFGEVWLADNKDELFAVKLPHKDQVDWKAITQEIGLWTLSGKHPNVMPLIGARNFNGQIAIISEYAPDGSLEDLLRVKGKLSVEEAVKMTIGILEGLQHLHESGIIHRDLKPANILLDGNLPRLTDFGISRIISADSLSETIAGTFAYMAPECFDGKRNVQTDIWSVGVILYRMLAGNLPFPQKEQTELIGAIIMREPKTLPDFVPKQLMEILPKNLAKNLAKRYQTTGDFLNELRTLKVQTNLQSSIEHRDELPFKTFDEILLKISSYYRFNGEVKINEAGHEFLRRIFEEIDIRKNKRIVGEANAEPIFDGLFLPPPKVKDIITLADDVFEKAKKLNYPDEELKNAMILIENIRNSAENNKGTAIVYLYEKVLPELQLQRDKYFQEIENSNRASNMGYVFREISKAVTSEEKKFAVREAIKKIQHKDKYEIE